MTDPMDIDTLIIVCGHAIWLGDSAPKASDDGATENGWLIEPFQRGETSTFIDHIKSGVEQLSLNESAILVFSGGATKPKRTRASEGESYKLYAMKQGLLKNGDLAKRTFAEADATDSFQNVLFSLLRFSEFVDRYHHFAQSSATQLPFPRKIILISHGFKRARFEHLHLPYLHYPTASVRFQYIGIDPPFDEQKMQEIREGDAKRGYGVWKDDLRGTGELLAGKRIGRGWTDQKKADFAKARRGWPTATVGMDEQVTDQFQMVIAFVEDDSAPFPEKAPWS